MEYAPYDPAPGTRPTRAEVTLRTARPEDFAAMARVRGERMEGNLEHHIEFFDRVQRRCRDRGYPAFWAAHVGGEVVGYSRLLHFDPEQPEVREWVENESRGPIAPAGWYLLGVNVLKRERRRGIGAELTAIRLSYIFERAGEAYYFTNEHNLASVDLHRPWGFAEATRDFDFPGVTFERGGRGILYRCTREAFAERPRP